jgi:hypothetical protein
VKFHGESSERLEPKQFFAVALPMRRLPNDRISGMGPSLAIYVCALTVFIVAFGSLVSLFVGAEQRANPGLAGYKPPLHAQLLPPISEALKRQAEWASLPAPAPEPAAMTARAEAPPAKPARKPTRQVKRDPAIPQNQQAQNGFALFGRNPSSAF